MNHLSIDIETLGTTPGSIILSVGFLAFDPLRFDTQEALIENGVEACVWANGPAFDMVLLEHAWRLTKAPPPWRYNWGRDIRTLGELTGLRPVVQGTAHNALHDAAAQAQFVQECYKTLGLRA